MVFGLYLSGGGCPHVPPARPGAFHLPGFFDHIFWEGKFSALTMPASPFFDIALKDIFFQWHGQHQKKECVVGSNAAVVRRRSQCRQLAGAMPPVPGTPSIDGSELSVGCRKIFRCLRSRMIYYHPRMAYKMFIRHATQTTRGRSG